MNLRALSRCQVFPEFLQVLFSFLFLFIQLFLSLFIIFWFVLTGQLEQTQLLHVNTKSRLIKNDWNRIEQNGKVSQIQCVIILHTANAHFPANCKLSPFTISIFWSRKLMKISSLRTKSDHHQIFVTLCLGQAAPYCTWR